MRVCSCVRHIADNRISIGMSSQNESECERVLVREMIALLV